MDVFRQFALYDNVMGVNIPDNIATVLAQEKESARAASEMLWKNEVEMVKDYLNKNGIKVHTVIDSERGVRIVFTDKKNENGNYTEYSDYQDFDDVKDNANFIKHKAREIAELSRGPTRRETR